MSDQDMPEMDRDKILAGEYALGLLPPDEAAAFAARLKSEPELRALYAGWAEDFAGLAGDVPPMAPPASVLRKIEAELFPAQKTSRGWFGMGWLAAGLAAVLLVFAMFTGLFEGGPMAPENPAYRAEITAQDGSLIVTAAYDAGRNTLFIERQAGTAAPGRALELWLIAGDNPPVSLGVLSESETAELDVAPALRPALDGGVLAISDEPPGGSPTGQPTGAVLAVGPVTKT